MGQGINTIFGGTHTIDRITPMSNQPTPENLDKGQLNGSCNRTACQQPGATWYNHSTKLYYCANCAAAINQVNRTDALRMYGHLLCTPHQPNQNQ